MSEWSIEANETTVAIEEPAPEVVNLHGRVLNPSGKPIPNFQLQVYGGRSTAEPVVEIASGVTDEEGRFHIRGVLPKPLRAASANPLQLVGVFWMRGNYATIMKDWTGDARDDNLIVTASVRPTQIQGRVGESRARSDRCSSKPAVRCDSKVTLWTHRCRRPIQDPLGNQMT